MLALNVTKVVRGELVSWSVLQNDPLQYDCLLVLAVVALVPSNLPRNRVSTF